VNVTIMKERSEVNVTITGERRSIGECHYHEGTERGERYHHGGGEVGECHHQRVEKHVTNPHSVSLILGNTSEPVLAELETGRGGGGEGILLSM
jgi:hypothetical protein